MMDLIVNPATILLNPVIILLNTLIITLWCCGIFKITEEGQVLGFITEWAKTLNGWRRYLLKPVILCITCMASFHGIIISLLLGASPITAITSIVCAAFLNTLVWNCYTNNL